MPVTQEPCAFHDELGGNIKGLMDIQASHTAWQAAEEVHRTALYKVLTDLQNGQSATLVKMGELEVALHKEFATKEELQVYRANQKKKIEDIHERIDGYLLKFFGLALSGTSIFVVMRMLL